MEDSDDFSYLDPIFVDLKILAEIRPHEKLSTQKSEITIAPDTIVNSLWRFFISFESFKKNIARVQTINETVTREVHEFIHGRRHNDIILGRLRDHLVRAATGLANWSNTYEKDVTRKAQIETQITKMTDLVVKIDAFFEKATLKKNC